MVAFGLAWIFLFSFLCNILNAFVTFLNTNENQSHNPTNPNFVRILHFIQKQKDFHNFVLYKTDHQNCIFKEILQQLQKPVIFLEASTAVAYKIKFPYEVVVLHCAEVEHNATKTDLSVRAKLQIARHVIYLPSLDKMIVKRFCLQSFQKDIYNQLILMADFGLTGTFLACRKLSANGFLELNLEDIQPMYINQFLNMNGMDLVTHPDQAAPRSMLSYNANGQLVLEGFIGKLIALFAQRYNATLKYLFPIELGRVLEYRILRHAVANGSMDIACTFNSNSDQTDFRTVSYPYFADEYCTMLPVPRKMPHMDIFINIVKIDCLLIILFLVIVFSVLFDYAEHKSFKKISLLDVFLNDKGIRGCLGQSYPIQLELSIKEKFICFLLGFAGLVNVTMYSGFLNSWLTEPPMLPMIKSFAEMKRAGLSICVHRDELENIINKSPGSKPLKIIDDYGFYFANREELNTAYVYPVSRTRWRLFEEQQKLFRHPLFYFSNDFCFVKLQLLGFPVRESLPYREQFETFILWVQETGLQQFWLSLGFYDMVRLGLTHFTDLSIGKARTTIVINMDDFYWIWLFYLTCILVCVTGFGLEWMAWIWRHHFARCRSF